MIKSSVFKNIISNLSDAVVLVRPVFHNDEISDFSVLYSNNQFEKMIKSRKNQDMNLSSLFEILSPNVDFVSVGKSSYSSNQEISQEFYSPELNMWLKVNVSEIEDDILMFIFQDVSRFMEKENLLRNQNLRMAAVSDELLLSKQALKSKLEKIESLNGFCDFDEPITEEEIKIAIKAAHDACEEYKKYKKF